MANFFATREGSILTGLLGGAVRGILPGPIGGIAAGALEIPGQLARFKEEKKLQKRQAQAQEVRGFLNPPAVSGGGYRVSIGGMPVASVPQRMAQSGSTALSHPFMTGLGDIVGLAMTRRGQRVAGRGVVPKGAPMPHPGGGGELMRRLLRGGVTAIEAALLGQQWNAPQGYGTLRWGPQGEAFYYKRSKKINPCNPKALSRALRRLEGFEKLAKRYLRVTSPGKKFKGFKKRRKGK